MTRAKPFATEAELCAAFLATVPDGWTAYAETAGWDILLAHASGPQIGIEAKLVLNAHVIAQAIDDVGRWWRRFALHIPIEMPGDDERFAILRRDGAPYRFADEDLDDLGALPAGASPALLRGVMENLVRSLVLAPRLGLDVSDPEALMRRIVASVQPPPEIEAPPLWQGRMPRFTAWPPQREAAA